MELWMSLTATGYTIIKPTIILGTMDEFDRLLVFDIANIKHEIANIQ